MTYRKTKVNNAYLNLLQTLYEAYPETFAPQGKASWPLKVGIHQDLIDALPDIKPAYISLFLIAYTNKRRYWRSLREGGQRRDLSGQPTGAVTAEEAAHALEQLVKDDARAKATREKPAQASEAAKLPAPEKAKNQRRKANTPGAQPQKPQPATPVEEPKPQTRELPKPGPVVVVIKKRSIDTSKPRQRLYDLTTK
jgi:ProP effector